MNNKCNAKNISNYNLVPFNLKMMRVIFGFIPITIGFKMRSVLRKCLQAASLCKYKFDVQLQKHSFTMAQCLKKQKAILAI